MSDTTPEWKVTQAVATQGRDANGNIGPGWNVTYQLASGATGQIFIPKTMASPDQQKAAVAADAAMLAQVSTLTSD